LKGNLQRLLESSIARFKAEYKVAANVTIDNPLGELTVETNYEVFEEVVSKILINAWEAYDNAPTDPRPISIHTRLIERSDEGKVLELRIDDAGHGLDEEIRDHIFEPFISSKHTVGVGMGLTVARHALRNLGGEVTVVDREDGGASVFLTHPVESRRTRKSGDE
jgi:signal transduction histidine kinase